MMKDLVEGPARAGAGVGTREGAGLPRQGWTMARVLREGGPGLRLRKPFRTHPYLETVTLAEVLASSLSLDRFLSDCRQLPHCGDVQISRLRLMLEGLARGVAPGMTAPGAPAPTPAPGPTPDTTQDTTPGGAPGSAGFDLEGKFYPDFLAAWESVYKRMWRLAYFDWFIYVPSSLPEFVKIPEVLRAELGPGVDLTGYLAGMGGLQTSLPAMTGGAGLVLIDARALSALVRREGPYRSLSQDAVDRQRAALESMLEVLPRGIELRVVDLQACGLSACAIVGDLVSSAVLGGYFVTTNAALRDRLSARCLEAARTAPTLRSVLDRGPR